MEAQGMFDLQALLDEQAPDPLGLYETHVNPALAKVLRIIGFDVRYVRGEGAYLYDERGTQYLDCLAGYAVFNCGRNHPVIRSALQQAMAMQLPNLVKMGTPRLSGLLARQLIELAPKAAADMGAHADERKLDTVFFTNCGAEGVETAIKYARAATGRPRIVHCERSFHGLTYGALSVNGNAEFRDGFGPLLEPCIAVPFNDLTALERVLERGDVAGFTVEPIQGKGVHIPSNDYLPGVRALCDRFGSLLIVDEVQTGFGRTGRMFACEHWGVEPDILVTAKALSGGYVPVGAVLSKRWIHDKVFTSLDRCVVHSTTFGGNDLAMAAGLATLHVLREEKLVENAARQGEKLKSQLLALRDKYDLVRDVRGKGLMLAIEFGAPRNLMLRTQWALLHKLDPSLFPQAILIPLLSDHHILAQVAGHHQDVIKLIPPLVLSDADVSRIVAAFDATIAACCRLSGPMWEVGKRLSATALRRTRETAGV